MIHKYSIDGVEYRSLADAEQKASEMLSAGRKEVIIYRDGINYSCRYKKEDGTVGFINLLHKEKSYE